ncbi:MAG: glycosyltransferase family 39 protein [Anaerolineae bacterium]|nr:glycosyltransferase family 39 protein [Anaerolineae bacterium]
MTTYIVTSTPEITVLQRRSFVAWLTVERAAYIVIVLVAAAIRFVQLGPRPLSLAEASDAWKAWQLVQDGAATGATSSPLVFALNLWTFDIFGATDFLARLWPALAGALLPLLAYPLRARLGRGGALVSATLLALSPHLIFFSRYLSGDSIVAFASLLLLVSLVRYHDDREMGWYVLGAVSLGLLLTSGASAYLALVGLGLFIYACGPDWWRTGFALPTTEATRRAIIGFGLFIVLGPTALLRRWDGLGDAAGLLAHWLAGFRPAWGEYPFFWPGLRLLLDEPLLAVGGVVAIFRWWQERQRGFETGLVAWAVGALVITSLHSGRTPGDLLVVMVPLALLAGPIFARFLAGFNLRENWREAAILLGAVATLAIMAFFWLAGYAQTGNQDYLLAFAVPLVILAGMAGVYYFGFKWEMTWRVLGLAGLVILAFTTVSVAWVSNHYVEPVRRPAIILDTGATGVRDLVGQVEFISAQRVADKYEIAMTIVGNPPSPMLGWYFRRFIAVRFAAGVGPEAGSPLVVTPESPLPPLGERYAGSTFPIRSRWSPLALPARGFIRWLLYRIGEGGGQTDKAVLWVEQPG